MRQLRTIAGLRAYRQQQEPHQTLGLVPTMGALHPGHFSLIQAARQENDQVAVSLFVNPLQFGPEEDLDAYPRTLAQDLQHCAELGVDLVFTPSPAELGMADVHTQATDKTTSIVPPHALTQGLCGASRPGHFTGVATIVTKLLNLVQPDRAYFGQKDAQQVVVLRRLVADLCLPVEIRTCPIARDPSGLAYSSRNQYLSPAQRQQATILQRSLMTARTAFLAGERHSDRLLAQIQQTLKPEPTVRLDYLELVHPETLVPLTIIDDRALLAIAAWVGPSRLLDNLLLQQRRPTIAIDGPAGVGKSTVTQQLAQRLELIYLDTGAMYRALTWQAQQDQVDLDDEIALAELAATAQIQFLSSDRSNTQRVLLNGQDVTTAIRSQAVTQQVSTVARQPSVRQHLVQLQQAWGQKGGIIAEGRDIGTVVFPEAEVKIFLTASASERAQRRWQDLDPQTQAQLDLTTLTQQIEARDHQDSTRATAPLRKAADALEIETDHLTIEQVIEQIEAQYYQVWNS
ncbi:MAG: bifunctional pantoate--beta-alanine ligase/(d)CMP kinase [Cyanobacteria bacterium P01_G01_bin.54]